MLLCKLRNAQNYSVDAGMLVGLHLDERAQFVRSGGQESFVGAVNCGVPQGSVLGPLLCISLNIDDVSMVIRYCRFHIYADDLQIYHSCAVSDFQKCIDELNLDLQRLYEWMAANGLKLNPIKSQVIVISRCRVDIPPLTLLIGSDVIKVVPKVNNLGFVLDERLTATDHFKKVMCQKVYWILRSLKPHASHTTFEVRRRLVVSLIMRHIGYGGIVYAGADAASQRRLNMAFRAYLRYIYSLRRLDHVSHLEISVIGALLTDYVKDSAFVVSLQSVACPASVLCVFAISFCFVRAYEEFGIPAHTWLPGGECAASWHEYFVYAGFICFRCEEDGQWR
jgi:hypothetical protein